MAKRRKKTNFGPFWRFLLVVYSLCMLWLLFGRSRNWHDGMTYGQMLRQNLNLTPLYTIRNYLNVVLHYPNATIYRHCVINLVGNVVMFIPAGWLLPRCIPRLRRFFPFLLCCVLTILAVECLQLLTLLGFFDVDDIILNLLGMLAGYLLYVCFRKK